MIPKKIYLSWIDKNVIHDDSPLILNGIRNIIDLNHNWDVTIYNDEEIELYLKGKLDTSDYDLISNKHVVAKTDIWRLMKLYEDGGVYIDIDRFCNISFDDILEPNIKMILPTCGDYDFSHDFMLSSPQNPIYLRTLNLMFDRMRNGETNINYLGAHTYMHAITESIFGKMIESNPGSEIFSIIRERISEINFVKTYREELPFDTIIYKHDPNTFKFGDTKVENPYDWEMLKRELYARYNLRHWTNEW